MSETLRGKLNDKSTAPEQHIRNNYDNDSHDRDISFAFSIAQDMQAATADSGVRADHGCSEPKMEAIT